MLEKCDLVLTMESTVIWKDDLGENRSKVEKSFKDKLAP